jgi:hypothetical protein
MMAEPRRLPPLTGVERKRRRLAVAVRLLLMALIGGSGLWLVLELDKARRAQNCLESGSRTCRILDVR